MIVGTARVHTAHPIFPAHERTPARRRPSPLTPDELEEATPAGDERRRRDRSPRGAASRGRELEDISLRTPPSWTTSASAPHAKQEARAYANADLLRSLLPIMDNFEMGLEAARAEAEKSMIFMGMNMVRRQIQDFLREQGVQEIDARQALRSKRARSRRAGASDVAAEGTVLRVTRRGFKHQGPPPAPGIRDRLQRPGQNCNPKPPWPTS